MSKCIVCGRNIPFAFEIFCSFGCRNKAEEESERMKVGDRVRVKKDGQLCWAKSGKVYVPDFYIGYVTYVNHGNGNLMVHLEELDGSVQTSIEHWTKVESE